MRYRVSLPKGRDISSSGSGIRYQAGRGDVQGRRRPRRTAEERDRFESPYAEIGSPRMRRCRDLYVQGFAMTRDVLICTLSLSERERGKERKGEDNRT